MSPRKKDRKIVQEDALTCRPLDSYSEILLFLENPPPWRSLCKGMTPHSKRLIRNIEINRHIAYHSNETTESFCHYNPDVEEVRRYDGKSLRKTMVCHDLANGYHDDSFIDGTGNSDAYTFYNWTGIDIFCYFSHHLITIPPVGWINMGHAHGVKVIGTVITEWAEGITFWEQVLVSETEYQNLANSLVAIAKSLKFDGWLLNIENKISKPDVLLEFVRYFHKLLHAELEDPVLIWYDSVTVQGNLSWQNGLNDKNKAFFDACDGFFTNYSWSVDDVVSSVEVAEERVTDLYIGIDVWGRNFYGGGQFNTAEAIKVAHHAGCSLAIFAPAWTHEALSSEKNDPNSVLNAGKLETYGQFLLRDRAFWGTVWPFLNTRVPCQLPFQTSFCRGQGKKRRMFGEAICPTPWYNIRHQQYQPNAAHGPHCFLLSTSEKKIKITRSGLQKGKKGIIKYHSSYHLTPFEDLSESNSRENRFHFYDSITHANPAKEVQSFDSSVSRADSHMGSTSSSKDPNKKGVMTAIKNMFKKKSSKSSDGDESKSSSKLSTQEDKNQQGTNRFKSEVVRIAEVGMSNDEKIFKYGSAEEKAEKGFGVTSEGGPSQQEKIEELPKSDLYITNVQEFKSRIAESDIQVKIEDIETQQKTSAEKKLEQDSAKNLTYTPEEMSLVPNEQSNTDIKNEEEENEPKKLVEGESEIYMLNAAEKKSEMIHKASTSQNERRSMMQMSMNLKLGTSAEKIRFGLTYVPEERECLQLYQDDSFIGGACLCVNPSDEMSSEHRFIRLFYCDFMCKDSFVFCVVTKTVRDHPSQTLNVHVYMKTSSKENMTAILIGHTVPSGKSMAVGHDPAGIAYVYPIFDAEDERFRELRSYLLIHEPSFYIPIENCYNWSVRYYEVRAPDTRILSINLRTGNNFGGILLGHFGVCHRYKQKGILGNIL